MVGVPSQGSIEAGAGGRETWRVAWSSRGFRIEALGSVAGVALAILALSHFLRWVESRPGTVVLADPILAALPARDFSVLTFSLIYGGLLVGLAVLLSRPRRLVRAAQAYVLLVLARILLMWLVPLEAPHGFVELRDPVVESLGPAQVLRRDLFFSGHASTLFLLALATPGRVWRGGMLLATAAVAILLVWQHVHYAVDVLVGPMVAFAAYEVTGRLSPGSRRVSGWTMRL
jgi:hypothetical protein